MNSKIAAIDSRCAEVERQRNALPRAEGGQIADSYDTLHGVRFISAILDTIPSNVSEYDRLQYTLYLYDLFLIQSIDELIGRSQKSLVLGEVETSVECLAWVERLLRLKHDTDSLFPPTTTVSGITSVNELVAGFERLCAAILEHLRSERDQSAQVLGFHGEQNTRLFHLSKNIVLQMKETMLSRRAPPSVIEDGVAEAHGRCVTAASRGLDLEKDTYINQFCLLHQLPELLTPLVLRRFKDIENALDAKDPDAAVSAARQGGDLLQLIVSSLWPLIERLYPAHYYSFREYLGATSGSSSAAIRGQLLTSAYVAFAKKVVAAHERDELVGVFSLLGAEIGRIRSLIYRWRGLHMALPRNVLGSNGTRSLMGSPDAIKAVETMAGSFERKDPLSAVFGPFAEQQFAANSAAAVLDRWLLATTGAVAQQRFIEVQERTGTWSRTPNTY